MKGGSTFVGQLFNQYPNSMYFYEPVAGFYSALYGSPDWTFPMEVLFNKNGSFRTIPEEERSSITDNMKQLFSCDIPNLPVESLQHQGLWLSTSTYNYRRCLQDDIKHKVVQKSESRNSLLSILNKHCVRTIETCIHQACDVFMRHIRTRWSDGVPHSAPYHNKGVFSNPELYKYYQQSRHLYRSAAESCIAKLHIPCATSHLIAAKALRLTMPMAQDLLTSDPALKMVYLVRDPRGIVISRKRVEYLSEVFNPNIQSEALLICPKMSRDYEQYLKVAALFPNRVLMVKYEDVADDTQRMVEKIYKFIGLRMTSTVTEWLKKNTRARSDGETYSTKRANSSATAHAWRQKIPLQLKNNMDNWCSPLLNKLGYEL